MDNVKTFKLPFHKSPEYVEMEEADSDFIEDELSRTSSEDDMINRSLTLDPGSLYGSISGDVDGDDDKDTENLSWNEACVSWWNNLFPNGYHTEIKTIFQIAWPLVLMQFFQLSLGPVALIFCGHLGKIELDAVSLANSLVNVTCISAATGLATACDTTFSLAYGSGSKRHKLGMHLQKSLLILTLGIFPVWAIYLNTENLLLAIGQDEDVSRMTASYMELFMPGALAFFIFISLAKYMNTQNIVVPSVIIGLITNIINILSHSVLVAGFGWGTTGSAISLDIAYISQLLIQLWYIRYSKLYEGTWHGIDWECLEEWGYFSKLALFGLLMICIEWWSFEIGVFVTGILGTTELGAQSIVFQYETLWFMLPFGTGIAVSIRVAQCLGAGDGPGAKASAWAAMSLIWYCALVVSLIYICLKDYLPKVFTDDQDVISLAADVLPIVGAFVLVDSITGVAGGVLRGSSRQAIGTVSNFLGYASALIIGVPIMFHSSLGLQVYWLTLLAAQGIQVIVFVSLVIKTDWAEFAVKAKDGKREERTHPTNTKKSRRYSQDDESALLHSRTYTMDMAADELIRQSEWNKSYLQSLIIKRATITLIFISMFVVGIIVRIACPPPSENDMDVISSTTVESSNITTDFMRSNLDLTTTTLSLGR